MTEKELKQYLQTHYPKETTSCEWKGFKNMKHFLCDLNILEIFK